MKDFNSISKKIQSKKIDSFSLETIEKMEVFLKEKQKKIIIQSENILNSINKKLNIHDGLSVNELKEKFKKIKIEYENLQDELNKIFHIKQSKILNNRLVKQLGSQAIVNIKQLILMFLILLVIGILYYDLANPELSQKVKKIFYFIDFTCCMIFLTNFYLEYRLADSKKWYWKSHFLDFITSLPLPDSQVIRLGRTFRLVRLTKFLDLLNFRIFRFLLFFSRI